MTALLVCAALELLPVARFYFTDPGSRAVVLLPFVTQPRAGGGLLPPPGPPSAGYLRAKPAQGDVVFNCGLHEHFGAARLYPGVGRAREWRLTYRIKVMGAGGLRTVYVDRTALVRVP